MRELFLLDPDVVFLNHGSFGACPRPVFERYQAWQRELEREPVDFIVRRLPGPARGGARRARRLRRRRRRRPDASSRTRHRREHGGARARPAAGRRGARDRSRVRRLRPHVGVGLRARRRARTCARRVDELVRAASPNGRASSSSRTSPRRPALLLPVEEIVARGRELGLITIVDGAHAPAHVAARPRRARRGLLRRQLPQVAVRAQGRRLPLRRAASGRSASTARSSSWGYARARRRSSHARSCRARATRPPISPVPAAIEFVREHDDARACVALAREARRSCARSPATEPIAPEAHGAAHGDVRRAAATRMSCSSGSATSTASRSRRCARRDDLMRISVAMYTEREDVERLLDALARSSEFPAALRDRQADERAELGAVRQRARVVFTGFQKPTPKRTACAPSICQSAVGAGQCFMNAVAGRDHRLAAASRSSSCSRSPGGRRSCTCRLGMSNSSQHELAVRRDAVALDDDVVVLPDLRLERRRARGR